MSVKNKTDMRRDVKRDVQKDLFINKERSKETCVFENRGYNDQLF